LDASRLSEKTRNPQKYGSAIATSDRDREGGTERKTYMQPNPNNRAQHARYSKSIYLSISLFFSVFKNQQEHPILAISLEARVVDGGGGGGSMLPFRKRRRRLRP
jgi:hypothetical protein